VADDGERVTIVEFDTEEAQREWRVHPEHAAAKRRGMESFFAEYKFQICGVIGDRSWVAGTRDTTTTHNDREEGSMRS
jgi:heme-degrading monooxygenase HmoA